MSRTAVDWRSASKDNYKDFCKRYPTIKLSFLEWRSIVYMYNDYYRLYILESGEKVKMPFGLGAFSIKKKKRKAFITTDDGEKRINHPVDWKKSRELGKIVYNLNRHTDGYFFGWQWFKNTTRVKYSNLWYFKASRTTSRLIAHYVNVDKSYQYLYKTWV